MQSRIFNKRTLPRQIMAMGMDVLCAWAALWLAICLRLDVWELPNSNQTGTYLLAPLPTSMCRWWSATPCKAWPTMSGAR